MNYMDTIVEKAKEATAVVYDIRKRYPTENNLAVIFDIDGTLLSGNKAIPPIVDFYNTCQKLNYINFIVTARDIKFLNETIQQLSNLDIDDYKCVYFRPSDYIEFENYKIICRKSIQDRGYNTVLSIGDSSWDIGRYGGYGVLLPSDQ